MKSIQQTLDLGGVPHSIYNISLLAGQGFPDIFSLPFSARILIENLARNMEKAGLSDEIIQQACQFYLTGSHEQILIPFYPGRVLMQDFTGVPAVVDLAAMRDTMALSGHDPKKINPLVPVDLIIDHSVQVDHFREENAFFLNAQKEYERNAERYELLKWAQNSFDNFRVVPPESGICHQVNLEYLAQVISSETSKNGQLFAFPDTLVGTDSHTTMINCLGVLGWGVGGIEAEAVMLGEPYYMNLPGIVGVRLHGKPSARVSSTDIALFVTQRLREKKVVEKIVEFTGPGLAHLQLTDRATISNMAPEYGATAGFFPVDDKTIAFLNQTNRKNLAKKVGIYCRATGFFNELDKDLVFSSSLDIDLSAIPPCVAGPSRPQDRIILTDLKSSTIQSFDLEKSDSVKITDPEANDRKDNNAPELTNGSIVIAAITSCTNTSNPHTMMGAGLLARKALEKGLTVPWYVKTSLSPGSRVVMDYLENAGLMKDLAALGFQNTGFGCMTCIGNSGPLDTFVEESIDKHGLDVMSVLSGNRNFEARIHQKVKGNFLMSPIMVVAFALAGRINIDMETDPLGYDRENNPVFLSDIYPSREEIEEFVTSHVNENFYKNQYEKIFQGQKLWQQVKASESSTFSFHANSTYIQNPPFFTDMDAPADTLEDIIDARALLVLGDSVTTDHISPAGAITKDSPAGKYLANAQVAPKDFNSYGSRRGNHEIMMRGTFANVRIKNRLVDCQGGYTRIFTENAQNEDANQIVSVFDAAMTYQKHRIPLVVFGGKEYGTGSSRDWAAKGTCLLGVKAVIAESFERIHRSNLVGMGVLPLVFVDGQTFDSLGLKGNERFSILGLDTIAPNVLLQLRAKTADSEISFKVQAKLNTKMEVDYIRSRGILTHVLHQMQS